MTIQITLNLNLPAVPNFPNGGIQYDQRYQNELNNILRLYLQRLRAGLAGLATGDIDFTLTLPYGSFYQDGVTTLTSAIPNGTSTAAIQVASTEGFADSGYIIIEQEIISYTTKTATTFDGTITRGVLGTNAGKSSHALGTYVSEAAASGAGTAAAAKLDSVILSNGVTCTVPDSKIYFDTDGVYNIQFSAQLLNYSTAEDNVTIWFKKNGTDIDYSASIEQVNSKHGTSPGATIVALNFVDSFVAGDYVELYWSSDSGDTVLATYPQSAIHPASPSLILTVQYVSEIP